MFRILLFSSELALHRFVAGERCRLSGSESLFVRQTPKGCQCVVVAVPVVEVLVEIVRALEVEVVLGPKRHQRVVNGCRSMEGTTITREGWHCLLVPGLEALSFQTFTPRNKL